MDINSKKILRDGTEVPVLGLGTYKSGKDNIKDAISCAYDAGYRHIDTASFYENEEYIGDALKSLNKSDIFLATKIWPTDFPIADIAIYASYKKLKADQIDLFMLHWPGTDKYLMIKTYEKLLEYKEKGKIKTVGVSNFMQHHLEDIKQVFGEYPLINQIELHPWQQQKELCEFCKNNGIAVTSWGPLMHGHLSEEELPDKLAAKYDVTPAQIVLRWHLQKDRIIIPKSIHRIRIIENAQLFDFNLNDEDVALLDALDRKKGFGADPDKYNGI